MLDLKGPKPEHCPVSHPSVGLPPDLTPRPTAEYEDELGVGFGLTWEERIEAADAALKRVSFFCSGDLSGTCGLGNATAVSCPEQFLQLCKSCFNRTATLDKPLRVRRAQRGRAGRLHLTRRTLTGPAPPRRARRLRKPARRGRSHPRGLAVRQDKLFRHVGRMQGRARQNCALAEQQRGPQGGRPRRPRARGKHLRPRLPRAYSRASDCAA